MVENEQYASLMNAMQTIYGLQPTVSPAGLPLLNPPLTSIRNSAATFTLKQKGRTASSTAAKHPCK